jgi:hypothetical protein
MRMSSSTGRSSGSSPFSLFSSYTLTYLSLISYLVITQPTPSVALENFILERCEEDAHIAVIVRTASTTRFPLSSSLKVTDASSP